MAGESKALTELVQAYAGPKGRMPIRDFAAKCVDPKSGYSPSSSLIGKIIKEQPFKVTPELISALAVGMGILRKEVASAAHAQYIGYDVDDLAQDAHNGNSTVRIAHEPDVNPDELPKSRAWLAAQEGER